MLCSNALGCVAAASTSMSTFLGMSLSIGCGCVAIWIRHQSYNCLLFHLRTIALYRSSSHLYVSFIKSHSLILLSKAETSQRIK